MIAPLPEPEMRRISSANDHRLPEVAGSPGTGLWTATLGFGAGLTTIVLYGVAGPEFMEWLDLTGAGLGLLLASPHLSKALLRIPFGAWVDQAGGRTPFLWLLALSCIGLAGLTATLFFFYPHSAPSGIYPALLLLGLLAGAGGATFSVGAPKTSYWFPRAKQGFALGIYAGVGNIGPGVFNFLIPLLVVGWGLTAAYAVWFVLLALATAVYATFAVDAFYFQLRQRDVATDEARRIAEELGQEIFPSGGAAASLRASARNYRTWLLVALYTVSFGGGFTALTAWFPTYWALYHELELITAGLLAAIFTIYGSLIRIPGGSLSDRFGGELVAMISFLVMAAGATVMMLTADFTTSFAGMIILGTGMGVANAAVFELVPTYVPEAVGGASGWIGGLGGAGTLVIVPLLGYFVDTLGPVGYARGFVVFVVMSGACVLLCAALRVFGVRPRATAQR